MTAFSRFTRVMAAVAAMMSEKQGQMTRAYALEQVGGYTSRGKGKAKRPGPTGILRVKRTAAKTRNQRQHKLNCRRA